MLEIDKEFAAHRLAEEACLRGDGQSHSVSTHSASKPLADQKSSLMFVAIVLFYIIAATTLTPRLLTVLAPSIGWIDRLALLLFIAQLNIFWFFGGYYAMVGLFTAVSTLTRKTGPMPADHGPPVAVLYATMNDFQERAALSCLQQSYTPCHTFILDDSTSSESRIAVDRFAAVHHEEVTVVRRKDRKGYKAGNLNSALRNYIHRYTYFAVVDSDSVLPKDFVSGLIPYFALDSKIGWVQGSHAPNPVQKTAFADELGLGILPLWQVYYGPRNKFGCVVFLGHGAILRYDVWEQIGGFPEVVSEDLAFSTEAGKLGYRGYFAPEVVSYEDFPENYRQFRKQRAKYVKGACEYLHRLYPSYFRSKNAKWFEKMDVFVSCGTLFLPIVVLAFMIVVCIVMPLLFGSIRPLTLHAMGHDVITIPVFVLGTRFRTLWTWWYAVLTFICTLSPALGWFCVMARNPWRGTKMFLLSGIPYLSLILMSSATIVSYLLSKRAVFFVTGDHLGIDPAGCSSVSMRSSRLLDPDSFTHMAEVVMGIVFMVVCIFTFNFTLMAFAISLVFGPLLLRISWTSRVLRPFLFLPYILIGIGLLLDETIVATAQGAMMSGFYFHF